MKILYVINKTILIITALLYLTIYLGLYAQIILGVIQVFSSLTLLFFWKHILKKHKNKVYMYWIIIILYGLAWLIDLKSIESTFFFILTIIIIPMSIAIGFVVLLNRIKNNNLNSNLK